MGGCIDLDTFFFPLECVCLWWGEGGCSLLCLYFFFNGFSCLANADQDYTAGVILAFPTRGIQLVPEKAVPIQIHVHPADFPDWMKRKKKEGKGAGGV